VRIPDEIHTYYCIFSWRLRGLDHQLQEKQLFSQKKRRTSSWENNLKYFSGWLRDGGLLACMLREPCQSAQCHPCPHPFGELCMFTLGPCESPYSLFSNLNMVNMQFSTPKQTWWAFLAWKLENNQWYIKGDDELMIEKDPTFQSFTRKTCHPFYL